MARSTRPVVHYMATRPDGTVHPTCEYLARYYTQQGKTITTVNLADHIGQTIDHPSPGKKWYTDTPFSYFHMYTKPGEILERIEEGWPVRLFVVEPRGETGNWGEDTYPYWLMSHQVHVVEETEAWRAFGHRGEKVLNTIAQVPDLARQWAEAWAADPDGTRRRYNAWDERLADTRAVSDWAHFKAQYSRRAAGLKTAYTLAGDAAEKAATDAGADIEAIAAIGLRARCLVAGQLLHDRICSGEYEKSIRALLLGTQLDTPTSVTA
ncbi:hypothetical protein ACFY6U_50485 [Streptomyces sp. NPDC013157]|uniref:hypothetical protein n=1 Tax=Streptomyces sp. NPDC013157 TaxID=3364861 RepID=UPI0036C00075